MSLTRPDSVGFPYSDGISNHKFHRLCLAAIAANAVEARAITETLASREALFGIIVEGRDYAAFKNQTYANHRVRVVAGICPWRIGDEEKPRLPAGQPFNRRCLQ